MKGAQACEEGGTEEELVQKYFSGNISRGKICLFSLCGHETPHHIEYSILME